MTHHINLARAFAVFKLHDQHVMGRVRAGIAHGQWQLLHGAVQGLPNVKKCHAAREQFLRLTQVADDVPAGYIGLAECLLRLDQEAEADDVIGRARARFGELPELLMLVARQLLRRDAFAEAEEILAPLTGDADRKRAGAAWGWIGVARLARGDRSGARSAAREALMVDRADAVALQIERSAQ